MNQQKDEAVAMSAAAKVGGAVSDLAAQTQDAVQEKIKEAEPLFRDLRASAGDAIDKATELARKASDVGFQAVTQASDAIQGTARELGSQAYQQGARAQGYVAQFVTEQPLTALLVAGFIGYGLAHLTLRRSA
jgi:ElaB/YqjD/DUF883 family membrane-anchored ribosome-binding protein